MPQRRQTLGLKSFSPEGEGFYQKWDNKHAMPGNALVFQAVIITIVVLMTDLLPSVNLMYQVLVLMTTIAYFIPYLIVVVAYVNFKRKGGNGPYHIPGGRPVAMGLSLLIFVAILLGIGLIFVPPSNFLTLKARVIYELELGGGPLLIVVIGMFLYWRARLKISPPRSGSQK